MILVVVSTGHFDPLLEECNRLKDRFSFKGQIGMSSVVPQFPYFRTCAPLELEKQMQEAELVISHGGTGMLSMLYRLKKPAVVCPKQIRYGEANDMQVQLAKRWAELGMAILCLDVKDLGVRIDRARTHQFVFPTFPSLGSALAKELVERPELLYSTRHG